VCSRGHQDGSQATCSFLDGLAERHAAAAELVRIIDLDRGVVDDDADEDDIR